jgi:hypothetical protein
MHLYHSGFNEFLRKSAIASTNKDRLTHLFALIPPRFADWSDQRRGGFASLSHNKNRLHEDSTTKQNMDSLLPS